MKHGKYLSLLVAAAMTGGALSSSVSLAQETPPSVAQEQSSASIVDESLLNLPDGKDVAFYRDAFSKLFPILDALEKSATSAEELRTTLDLYAPSAKVLFDNLAKAEEDPERSCGFLFTVYTFHLALNDRVDEAKAFARAVLDSNAPALTVSEEVELDFGSSWIFRSYPSAKEKAQSLLEEMENENYLTVFNLSLNKGFFENAYEKKDVERARDSGRAVFECALTSDEALDETSMIVYYSGRLSSEFGNEMRDKAIETLTKSEDPKRQKVMEEFVQAREERYLEDDCEKKNVDAARAQRCKMIEASLTNDVALEGLTSVVRISKELSSEFSDETRKMIVDALANSEDPARRKVAEEFVQEEETRLLKDACDRKDVDSARAQRSKIIDASLTNDVALDALSDVVRICGELSTEFGDETRDMIIDALAKSEDSARQKVAKRFVQEKETLPFVNACGEGNAVLARAQRFKAIEATLANDALGRLNYLVSISEDLSPEFSLETLDMIIDALAQSEDSERRELVEKLTRERESRARLVAGKDRFNALPGGDLELNGLYLDNTEIDWSSYRGKVTLVDVWATWCDPCVNEIPNALKLYRKYHDSGLEILAYSVDKDLDELTAFAEAKRLPWKIASLQLAKNVEEKDGKERFNFMTYYGIERIPCMILVDRDGKVIDTNARGERLEELLEKAIPVVKEPSEQTLAACQAADDAWFLSNTESLRKELERDCPCVSVAKLLDGLAGHASRLDRWEDAVQYAKRGIAVAKDDDYATRGEYLNDFAWTIIECPMRELRDGDLTLEAALQAAEAYEFKTDYVNHTLAAAYAEVGDFENALKWAQNALELAESNLQEYDVEDEEVRESYLKNYIRAVERFSEKKTWRE